MKKKRQRCFDCVVSKYESITYRPNMYNSNDIEYIFDMQIDKSSMRMTLENMIRKYGLEEGTLRFDEYRSKQAYTNTLDYKREKYGWSEKEFDDFNKSRATTLENMIRKYGLEEGTLRFNEYRSKQAYTNTIDHFIDKHGYHEGKKIYEEINKQKGITLENMIRVHGSEDGIIKYHEYMNSKSQISFYSKISQELFNILQEQLEVKAYFAENNNEFGLHSGTRYFLYDFVVHDLRKIIEFNGDYWHANPEIYDSNWINPQSKKSAVEIWNFDTEKNLLAKEKGYDILIVWESDYLKDKKRCIDRCMEFLKYENRISR